MSTLREHLIDLFARTELATHTTIAGDGGPMTVIHGNREAAGCAADAILADPRLAVVELPEPDAVHADATGRTEWLSVDDGPGVTAWRDGEVSVDAHVGGMPADVATRFAIRLLAAARKAASDARP